MSEAAPSTVGLCTHIVDNKIKNLYLCKLLQFDAFTKIFFLISIIRPTWPWEVAEFLYYNGVKVLEGVPVPL